MLNLAKRPFLAFPKTFKAEESIHSSSIFRMKEIVERKEGNKLIIETVIKDSERKPYMLKTPHDGTCCVLCRLNLTNIKHTDVLILSQFVRSDGCMLPRRITGLCGEQQRRMTKLVSMAHIAGLMPNLVPFYSKENCFNKRRGWKRYNTYFDEKTILIYDSYYKDTDVKKQFFMNKGIEIPERVKRLPNKYVKGPHLAAYYSDVKDGALIHKKTPFLELPPPKNCKRI